MTLRLSMIPIVLGLVAMVLAIPIVVMKATQRGPVSNFKTQAGKPNESSVSFFPTTGRYKYTPGMEVPVAVIIESSIVPIKNVDLEIAYSPNVASVTGLGEGIIFDRYLGLKTDTSNGKLAVGAENDSARPITGIVASFKLVPKGKGNVVLRFSKTNGVMNAGEANYIFE